MTQTTKLFISIVILLHKTRKKSRFSAPILFIFLSIHRIHPQTMESTHRETDVLTAHYPKCIILLHPLTHLPPSQPDSAVVDASHGDGMHLERAGCKSEVKTLRTNWGKSTGGNYPEVFVDCSPPVFSGYDCVVGDCFTTCTESEDLQGVIDSRQVCNSNSFFSTCGKLITVLGN